MNNIVFMGTPDFSVPILNTLIQAQYRVGLVVTQPDRPKGRKRIPTPPPVKTAALEAGIPVYQPEHIKTDHTYILDFKPDLIVTAAYGQILPEALLEAPTYGCINVHASLLPELRGGAPIHRAIIEGKNETGISIMYMIKQLDAGDVLTQKSIPIDEDDDVGSLHDKLSVLGAECLMDILPHVFASNLQPISQDHSKATFAANIQSSETQIDWTQDHTTVYNHIRGLAPWPVAQTLYQGTTLKIWQADKDDTRLEGEPGDIATADEDSFTVVCGNQKGIRVREIQPAGKKRMSVGDFLRGQTGTIIGAKLGD